jgi:hypothetical protein
MKNNVKSKNGRDHDVRQAHFGLAKVPRPISSEGDIIVKKLTYNVQYLLNGAGVLPVTTINTAQVESDPASEWSSFAARYQQYRVKALSLTGYFVMPNGSSIGNPNGSPIVLCDYLGSSAPSSATQIVSDERSEIRGIASVNGSLMFVFETDWFRNPNAKLWNPTSAATPTANSYGIAFASHPQAVDGTTNAVSIVGTVCWLVEFRGSQ